MASGLTHWSNCSPVRWPEARAASRRLVFSLCAFWRFARTRASDSKSYTTLRFGSEWITRGSAGQSFTTSKLGDDAITRGRDGQTVTTSRFGSGTISGDSKGATTGTQRFGDGTRSAAALRGPQRPHRALGAALRPRRAAGAASQGCWWCRGRCGATRAFWRPIF